MLAVPAYWWYTLRTQKQTYRCTIRSVLLQDLASRRTNRVLVWAAHKVWRLLHDGDDLLLPWRKRVDHHLDGSAKERVLFALHSAHKTRHPRPAGGQ